MLAARPAIQDLRDLLREEVRLLLRDDGTRWKQPIRETVRALQEAGIEAVLFGGTLRSLLISRLYKDRPGRPRDIDLVVAGPPFAEVEERFGDLISRRTRFGGIHLQKAESSFDVWAVWDTWAFREQATEPSFEALPYTTPFNLEAIAVDAWVAPGRPRRIYAGDDQFFRGLLSRTIELNYPRNPYPALTAIRAIVLGAETHFSVGPALAKFVAQVGAELEPAEIEDVQRQHYGYVRLSGGTVRMLIDLVAQRADSRLAFEFPSIQPSLWPDDALPRLRIHWSKKPRARGASFRMGAVAPGTRS
ncbi:MAG: hypothetical protein ACRDGT_04215 [Candidatus Limnocylindria bacterium]